MGFTFGPLFGIFFQQRAFSHWKSTMHLPSRIKAIPEHTRYQLPALAPCIGGAVVLVLLALFLLCETGIRFIRRWRNGVVQCTRPCCNKAANLSRGASPRNGDPEVAGLLDGEGDGYDEDDFESGETMHDSADDPRMENFIKAYGARRAHSKFGEMMEWREAHDVDTVMDRSVPQWKNFKQAYPFYIHGRAKDGCIVAYELPGHMDLAHAVSNGGLGHRAPPSSALQHSRPNAHGHMGTLAFALESSPPLTPGPSSGARSHWPVPHVPCTGPEGDNAA